MEKSVKDTLSGKNNKRIDNTDPTNCEGTAAWANNEKNLKVSNVSIPAEYDVDKAKNWVDNGSRL